ncbi:MAG: ABC transporter permease [Comamonas sp.]|jgi:capsular polysaccharide transport system permease protein|uniref:ABC transporter permease n=1 Tax=Comamonas sp. TaxID=34028 RepID=UPI0028245F3C|nr:ABC transporter permease [Comamonas sp.]MDR0215252.1 ABC transporter permease [Comamonas sp.]
MDSAPLPEVHSAPRNSLSVTFAVWNALFLREAVARLSATRGAWVLIVLEPVLHVSYMLFIYTAIRAKSVAGADVALWLVLGMTGYFTVQHIFRRAMGAIDANKALFAYRQVRPIDTVIVRAALEALLGILVLLALLIVLAFLDRNITPSEPMETISAFFGLILSAFGIGLILSVVSDFAPEVGNLVSLLFRPLFILSGVIFPLSSIPVKYREWAFYNPFAHGLELLRSSFFPIYHAAPEANFRYLYGFALVTIFLGLALQVRFAQKLRSK